MVGSIFQNFDPEEMELRVDVRKSFGPVPHLYSLILSAISSCGRVEVNGQQRTLRRLKSHEFRTLANRIEELAQIGFEHKADFLWTEKESASIEFDEHTITDWAIHACLHKKNGEISAAQVYALGALELIDDATTAASSNGVTLSFVEDVSLAGIYVAEARESYANDAATYWRNFSEEEMEIEFRERKSSEASRPLA